MAKEKKETAEQKLLKVIESAPKEPEAADAAKPADTAAAAAAPAATADAAAPAAAAQPTEKKASQTAAEAMAASVKGGGIADLKMPAALDPVVNLLKGVGLGGFSLKSLGFREINKVVTGLAVIVAVLFVMTLYNGMRSTKTSLDFNIPEDIAQVAATVIPLYQQLAVYLDNIQRRNIFQPVEKDSAQAVAYDEMAAEGSVSVVVKDLKLVGVSWSDIPSSASAMLEDTITGATYFLKEGEQIKNATIKKIYADRVTLTYQGEETMLRL